MVYPDGMVLEDDMNELEDALASGDITRELFNLAIATSEKLKTGLLSDIKAFKEYTIKCLDMMKEG